MDELSEYIKDKKVLIHPYGKYGKLIYKVLKQQYLHDSVIVYDNYVKSSEICDAEGLKSFIDEKDIVALVCLADSDRVEDFTRHITDILPDIN